MNAIASHNGGLAYPSSRSLNIEYDEARAGSTCHRLDQKWPTGATPADITPRHGGHARAHSARSLRANSERETPLAYSMWHQTSRLAAMLLRDGLGCIRSPSQARAFCQA